MFYDNICAICKELGTSPTKVLRECGFSTGNISKWKNGSVPNTDLVVAIAKHLNISIDYLMTMQNHPETVLTQSEREWLDIISRIPEKKHAMLKDFLKTHMEIPEKYEDKREA